MYTRITKTGDRQYLQLVEAYRNDRGQSRVRVVANLGRLDRLTPSMLDPLINGLNRAVGRAENTASEVVHEPGRSYGDVFALHGLWRDLGIDKALQRALRSWRRGFDAESLIRAMVFNRLCAPESKLGCLRWLETVAMPGLPQTPTHQQLLRAMDALMDNLDPVEAALSRQFRPLVDRDLSIVFYDLTTVRIHGEAEVADDLRAFGMNKERGGIARQFVLGVVQSAEGLPLLHTVHPGNVAETKTLQGMLEKVLAHFPIQRVVLVADRGLLSLESCPSRRHRFKPDGRHRTDVGRRALRSQAGVHPRRSRASICRAGRHVPEPRLSRWRGRKHLCHRLIVAHDPLRAEDQSHRRRARIAELEAMADRLVARLDAQDEGQTTRGRRASDRGAYSRFARAVAEAELTRFIKPDLHADRFSYTIDEAAIRDAELFDGKLAVLTNASDIAPAEAVARYRSLADIERGFRVLKSDVEIAPVHHRLPERIRAHAMICFLALVLHRVMRMRLKARGHSASPRTALDLLARIQKHTAHIGERSFHGTSTTTPEQLDLFDALSLPKPA